MASITINVPDQYVSRILDACEAARDSGIRITGHLDTPMRGAHDVPIDGAASGPALAKSVIVGCMKAIVKMYETGLSVDDYKVQVAAILPEAVVIPDEIVS